MKTFHIIFLAVIVLLSSLLVGINNGYAFDKKKYSTIPIEEARKLVEEIITNRRLPSFGYSWKLPDSNLYTQGVRINGGDYIIFVSAKTTAISDEIILSSTTSLSKFIPEIEKMPFSFNGILFSTFDLEVINKQVFTRPQAGGDWAKIGNLIKKGGYVWYLGQVGILVRGSENMFLICFGKPMKKYSPEVTHLFDLFSTKDSTEIYFKVGGEVIQLK